MHPLPGSVTGHHVVNPCKPNATNHPKITINGWYKPSENGLWHWVDHQVFVTPRQAGRCLLSRHANGFDGRFWHNEMDPKQGGMFARGCIPSTFVRN